MKTKQIAFTQTELTSRITDYQQHSSRITRALNKRHHNSPFSYDINTKTHLAQNNTYSTQDITNAWKKAVLINHE